jgi:ATP-binding cassette subfamily C exporter for protease/lipase
VAPAQAASAANAQAARFLASKLSNAALLESMGMVGGRRARWEALRAAAATRDTAAQAQVQRIAAWSKWLRYCQQSLGLAAGALLVIDGQLSPGAMIATNLMLTRALAPVDQFVSGWRGFIAARAAFARLEALLASPPPPRAGLATPPSRAALTLVGASAGLPGQARLLLQPLHLSLAAGTVMVVQGPSGSGKSTLARLLLGLWPPAAGTVHHAGRPLADWDATALGAQRGYLPQEVDLLEGSVADNIARHATPDADRVLAAARSAGLHELILKFPKGYDTPVGESGEALSGGQRQRIGLARALYGDPGLVVLDEPDAHLDELGELALQQAVVALRARGSSVVLITHHPALASLADRRLVLAAGRVVSDELA